MEDRVIVKNTFGGTFRKVLGKCFKLILAAFPFVMFLLLLISTADSIELIVALIGIAVFGGYLLFYIIKMLAGKTIAIISNEGLAICELDLAVVKWENIRTINKELTWIGALWDLTAFFAEMYDSLTIITITYIKSEAGEEATVSFHARTSNFTHSQILKEIKKYQDKLQRSDQK